MPSMTPASDKLTKQIEDAFTYHPPKDADQKEAYETMRREAKRLAWCFANHVPESRELSLALTKLQEAVMWANAGVAINT